jgi:hypothetical protein
MFKEINLTGHNKQHQSQHQSRQHVSPITRNNFSTAINNPFPSISSQQAGISAVIFNIGSLLPHAALILSVLLAALASKSFRAQSRSKDL